MKKHQALQAEIAGHESRIKNVCTHGNKMTDDGHFASEEIQQKIEELQDRWKQLKVKIMHLKSAFIIYMWTHDYEHFISFFFLHLFSKLKILLEWRDFSHYSNPV